MFELFKKFVVEKEKISKANKHCLLKVDINAILLVEEKFKIPEELKLFYLDVGYGFFCCQTTSFRIFSPSQLININLKEDFYEYDPQLEIYDFLYNGNKLLFFEVIEGNYLAIDKVTKNGKNSVYHYDKKIADSLEEFLINIDKNCNFLEESSYL